MTARATCACGAEFAVPDSTPGRTVQCACGRVVALPPPASWRVRVEGREYGPYEEEDVRRFAREGRLPPTAEVSVGGAEWERAGDRPDLFPRGRARGGPLEGAPDLPRADDRGLAVLAHVLGIFTGLIGPLVMVLAVGRDRAFVRHHAKQSLAWQVLVLVAAAVAAATTVAAVFRAASLDLAPILLVVLVSAGVGVADLVFCVLAAVAGWEGKAYRYPVVGSWVAGTPEGGPLAGE